MIWDITKEDHDLLVQVAERALRKLPHIDDKRTIVMDLCACHSNGCPLDFKGLLAASMQDFSHDVYGIREHINRDTGKLEDCFLPRYALRNRVEAQ